MVSIDQASEQAQILGSSSCPAGQSVLTQLPLQGVVPVGQTHAPVPVSHTQVGGQQETLRSVPSGGLGSSQHVCPVPQQMAWVSAPGRGDTGPVLQHVVLRPVQFWTQAPFSHDSQGAHNGAQTPLRHLSHWKHTSPQVPQFVSRSSRWQEPPQQPCP